MKDPRLKGMDVRYGGRTIEMDVFVNTDASLEEIACRVEEVKKLVRGPRMDMVIVAASEIEKDAAEEFWAAMIGHLREYTGEKKS